MEEHRFGLAKKGKHICPSCGRKSFVFYLDNTTGNSLHSTVGKCDRIDNCGHHYSPKQYFTDNNISFDNKKEYAPQLNPAPKPKPSFIDEELLKRSLTNYEQNNLVQWLSVIVGGDKAVQAIERYFVGTSKNGGTVFWQIDLQGKARAGKIISYDTAGHRRKDIMPPVQWVHSILKLPDFVLSQCLFGEHLLSNKTKPVAIVEAEKTAIIASIYLPDMIWLACGGSEGLNADKCAVLRGRNVVLFPDCSVYYKWSLKAKELSKICNVVVSSLIEKNATVEERERGFDLADYLVRFPLSAYAPQLPEVSTVEPRPQTELKPKPVIQYSINSRRENWDTEISELETWLSETKLPDTSIRLSEAETIIDCRRFVDSHLSVAKAQNGILVYRPYLDRLLLLQQHLLNLN